MAEPALYERLGGIFAIVAVADNFSDQLLRNPKIVDANPRAARVAFGNPPHADAGLNCSKNLLANPGKAER